MIITKLYKSSQQTYTSPTYRHAMVGDGDSEIYKTCPFPFRKTPSWGKGT